MIWLVATSSASSVELACGGGPVVDGHGRRRARRCREERLGQQVELVGPELGVEQVGQAQLGEREGLGEPRDLLGLQRHALACGTRRRRRATRPRRAAAMPRPPRPRRSGTGSRPGEPRVAAVDHDRARG